jgi:hypothetical protein
MISEKMHIRLMRDDLALQKLLERLELLWYSKNTPVFHRFYFLKYLYSAMIKNVEELILNEEKIIKEERHAFSNSFKAINAREACLRQLKRQLTDLSV